MPGSTCTRNGITFKVYTSKGDQHIAGWSEIVANRKEYKELVRELRAQGWKIESVNSGPGHYQAKHPDGRQVFHFAGSGDPRAFHNTLKQLKRMGFQWAA
jgi:hypothetical protein